MRGELNLRSDEVRANEHLPPQVIALTTTRIIAAAIATRDYQPVHHDVDLAASLGNAGIFLNTHTTAGFLECYVQAWAGRDALIKSVKFRLGVPGYAGDTLHLSGEVLDEPTSDALVTVKVIGTNSLGTHVDGEVCVQLANA